MELTLPEFVHRFLSIPRHSFFLFGPRGTGKTTWLRQAFPEALVLDLLKPAVYRQLNARPEKLVELVTAAPGKKEVVIDEFQRVPELLTVVHDLIERAKGCLKRTDSPFWPVSGLLRPAAPEPGGVE